VEKNPTKTFLRTSKERVVRRNTMVNELLKTRNGVSLRMENVALKDSKYTNSHIKP
jgi:hypothetical protein